MFLFNILELSVSSEMFSCIYLLEDFKRGKHLNLRDGGFSFFSLLFPTFFCFALTFLYVFLKMPFYPYLFTLKCHLGYEKIKFFVARFAHSNFIN